MSSPPVQPVERRAPSPDPAAPRWWRGSLCLRWLMPGVLVLLLVVGVAVVYLLQPSPPLPRVRLVTTSGPFSAAVLLADSRGWFRAAGVDVEVSERATGRIALGELADGRAEFATASETPIMFALLKPTPIRIIASLSVSSDNTMLVARRDRGIETSDDLPGRRVAYPPWTNAQYFLDTFLEYRGHKQEVIERIPLKPEELIPALIDGKVDAIACWVPYNFKATKALGSNAVELRIGSIYRWSWNLVARDEPTAEGAIAPRIISALMRATAEIIRDPQTCAAELAQRIGLPPDKLLEVWKHSTFEVTLDQSLLLNMEQQARWAAASGLTETKEVPNFLGSISTTALRAIDPEIVTLVDGTGRP